MKRFTVLVLLLAVSIVPATALAQSKVVSVNQFVEHPSLDTILQGFKDYFTERNLDVKYNVHNAQANMATTVQIASQIAGENPDLVVGITTPSAQACAQKIRHIPVLATAVTDMVGAGLVKSLEVPGGNVTGTTDMLPVAKQIALIKEIHPTAKRIGVIFNAGEANSVTLVNLAKAACESSGMTLEEATVLNSAGVYPAAKSLAGRVDAVWLPTDNTVISALESAIKVFTESKIPLYTADNESVKRGSVAALAFDYYKLGYQTGAMAKRILFDGADVATMPIESLQELDLHINQTAAKSMGVTIPDTVLERAAQIYK